MYPQYSTHNAYETTAHINGSERPIIPVETLLELARWCRERRKQIEGAEPCITLQKTKGFPPAPGEIRPGSAATGVLERTTAPDTPSNTGQFESDSGPEPAEADNTAGGGL